MELEINGASATWNLEIAEDEFTNYIVNGVLEKSINSHNDIDDIYEWNVVRQYNLGKGKIAEPYKKIYKEALDKIKDSSLKELFTNKKVKEQYTPTIQDERIMELPINELSPAQLRRIYESPEDSKDFRVQLKKGVEDYEEYFNDIYSERSSNALKTVRIDEEQDFKNRAKFKTLVNAGFTNIKIKAENRQSTSSNLMEDTDEKPQIPKAGKRDKDSGTGDLLTSLYKQRIPLVVKGFAKRTIQEGSTIDPIVLEMGVQYDIDNESEANRYRDLNNIPMLLEDFEKTIFIELKKEMLEVEREFDKDKDKRYGKEDRKLIEQDLDDETKIVSEKKIMAKAKDRKVSQKVAKELLALKKDIMPKLFIGSEKKLDFGEVIGIPLPNNISQKIIVEKISYLSFFKGDVFSNETTLSLGNYVEMAKEKIIEDKTVELAKKEKEFYKDTRGKKPFRDEEGKGRDREAFTDTKEFLKETLKPYLNDLENVYDIDFKVSAETNKKGKTTYAIKRFLAKPKNIIFKGGGRNPYKKRKETKIIESRKDIASLNAFINSILSRIDTLERGI